MSEASEKVAKWFRFKLMEAVNKQDVLYKDKEDKAVMQDKEKDVHDSVSDLLLRVLSKDDIKKLNYINGFNPEPEIRKEVLPNPKKKKIKESVLTEDEEANNAEGTEEQTPVDDVENVPNLSADTGDAEPVEDVENEGEAKSDEEVEDDTDEAESKDKGVGAFDRILEKCEKDEILAKAIEAVNSPDIAKARDVFYEWFDSYDDEHMSDELPVEDEEIISDENDSTEDKNEPEIEEPSADEKTDSEEDSAEEDDESESSNSKEDGIANNLFS